ncbi:MAG TPA: D-alanyl-D-alanine carboxypeptidase family protein [Rhodanobacteraceae bacterium]|nr:D-alanyl-D-alanine carboxypeptidase family protein [Rhodanobacteraceae bacterium]
MKAILPSLLSALLLVLPAAIQAKHPAKPHAAKAAASAKTEAKKPAAGEDEGPNAPPEASTATPAPGKGDAPMAGPPAVDARAWVLLDYATGQVLAGEHVDDPLEPASITKVMTSYVVAAEMKNGKVKMDDEVFISEHAWRSGGAGTDGSFSALALNSKVKLQDVLHGLIIQSGNDAAIALAEHVAGSEDAFAQLMNQYAQRLGMTHSHFVNAHGLSAPGHEMSAHDIAILSRALIRDFPDHYALYSIKDYTYGGIKQYNRNGLLWKDASVDGIKTGHTASAGYCLAASARRGDQRLISVVMGVQGNRKEGFKRREEYNLALLNYGFRFFETHRLYEGGKAIAQPTLWKGEANTISLGVKDDIVVTIPRGRYGDLKAAMDVPGRLVAPYAKGQQLGTLRVSLDGKPLLERPIVAVDGAPEGGFFKRLGDGMMMWFKSDEAPPAPTKPNTQ